MTWTGAPDFRPSPVSGWGTQPAPFDGRAVPPRPPMVKAPLRARLDPANLETRASQGFPRQREKRRKQGWLGRVLRLYGWRVYMVPVLAVVTTVLAVDGLRGHEQSQAEPAATSARQAHPFASNAAIGIPPLGNVLAESTRKSGALPTGSVFTEAGLKSWTVIPGGGDRFGPPDAKKFFRYVIETEDGVDPASFISVNAFASTVDRALHDPHSWIAGTGNDSVAFQRISADEAQRVPTTDSSFFRISLTSPKTTQQECGYDIQLETSCFQPQDQRVVLNLARWVRGANAFGPDFQGYWTYMANHEVGHAIGHVNHVPCPEQDALAPIMMQQSFGVANNDIADLDPAGVVPPDGKVCRPNPYPYP